MFIHDKNITDRVCYACGKTETQIAITKNGISYPRWTMNYDIEDNVLCHKCNMSIIINPKRLYFKGITITMGEPTRKKKCSRCSKIGRTNMHHWVYIIIFPWFGTEELCVPCHTAESWRLKQITNNRRGHR